jgi:hypothetical protein
MSLAETTTVIGTVPVTTTPVIKTGSTETKTAAFNLTDSKKDVFKIPTAKDTDTVTTDKTDTETKAQPEVFSRRYYQMRSIHYDDVKYGVCNGKKQVLDQVTSLHLNEMLMGYSSYLREFRVVSWCANNGYCVREPHPLQKRYQELQQTLQARQTELAKYFRLGSHLSGCEIEMSAEARQHFLERMKAAKMGLNETENDIALLDQEIQKLDTRKSVPEYFFEGKLYEVEQEACAYSSSSSSNIIVKTEITPQWIHDRAINASIRLELTGKMMILVKKERNLANREIKLKHQRQLLENELEKISYRLWVAKTQK